MPRFNVMHIYHFLSNQAWILNKTSAFVQVLEKIWSLPTNIGKLVKTNFGSIFSWFKIQRIQCFAFANISSEYNSLTIQFVFSLCSQKKMKRVTKEWRIRHLGNDLTFHSARVCAWVHYCTHCLFLPFSLSIFLLLYCCCFFVIVSYCGYQGFGQA